uniref:NADH-ubiquinone oxidoreductase chain 4L n=1 Tax=Pandalus japonicus TaxID=666362 RepID=A0A516F072_PANJP|nr:NADH dehydrogenase subunit 4L [Pandalus japonicus]
MTMLTSYLLIPIASVFCGALAFVSGRKHLLNTLLSLEFVMLSIFWLLTMSIASLGGDCFFVLFFLALASCEGALGLGLLISIVRSHGNDNFSSFNVLQC